MKSKFTVAVVLAVVLALLPVPFSSPSAWATMTKVSVALDTDLMSTPFEEPMTMVGVSWEGTSPVSIQARVLIGDQWGPWRDLASDADHGPDVDTPEGRRQRLATVPVWVGNADGVQFRVTGGYPKNLEASLIDTSDRTKPLLRRLKDAFAPGGAGAGAAPSIHPRSEWDPTDSCKPADPNPVEYVQVTTAFVHHTAGWNTYSQAEVPGYILGICKYHVDTRGWNDIGYNFLIDRFGGIWEGRKGGIDKGVQGAHTQGFNSYSTGVVLLGSFNNTGYLPSQAAIDSLVELLAWKFSIHNVDPLGTTTVVSKGSLKYPQGVRVTFNAISGHRDAQATACPGDDLYVLLPSVRQSVAARFRALPLDTYVSPVTGDFTGDGTPDGAVFRQGDGTWWVTDGVTGSTTQWADYATNTGWTSQVVGDFNGDGRDDIANFWAPDAQWFVSTSTGIGFTTTLWADYTTNTGWGTQLVGDFNGDGRDDIANFWAPDAQWFVSTSTGTGFTTTLWADYTTNTGWGTQLVGDFNGDGRDDIANFWAPDAQWFVSTSTGTGFTTTLWADLSPNTGWGTQLVGDFNGDGKDGIASFHTGTERWWPLESEGTVFKVDGEIRTPTADHWSLAFVRDSDGNGRDDIVQLDAYDGSWHWITKVGSVYASGDLEDSPYRTTVSGPTDAETGGFLAFFGQEFSWLEVNLQPGDRTVSRVSGSDRYETAAAISAATFPSPTPTVYIATGANYPDGLAGTAAAAHTDAPLLLVTPTAIPTATATELTRLQPDTIIILGGTTAVSTTVANQLTAYGTVSRVSGSDRYETAAAISAATFPSPTPTVYIATGANYPDGLAGTAAAAHTDAPLLLVTPTAIPTATATELTRLQPDTIIILGGTTAVSTTVANELAAVPDFATSEVRRLPR